MQKLIETGCVLFPSKPGGRPREKKFRSDIQTEFVAFASIIDDVFTGDGTTEIRALFGEEVFDFSKPSTLLTRLVRQGATDDSIVLDFFAGSGTTAHAVLDLNKQDGGNRKFILVQLPEPTGRTDYPTIADLTKERVRRVIQKLNDEGSQQSPHQSLALTPTPALPLKWGGSGSSVPFKIKNLSGGERNRLKSKGSGDIVPSPP
jgi:hypothetical protein